MKICIAPYYSEKRFIKKQSSAIAEERLGFLDGKRLGDLSIGIEDNATCRKIRRIMEKRVAQNFWSNASRRRRRVMGLAMRQDIISRTTSGTSSEKFPRASDMRLSERNHFTFGIYCKN